MKKLFLILLVLCFAVSGSFADGLGITNRYAALLLTNGAEGVMGVGMFAQFSQGFPVITGSRREVSPYLSVGYVVEIMAGIYDEIPFYGLDIIGCRILGGGIGGELKAFTFLNLQLMLGAAYILDRIDAVFKGRIFFEYIIPGTMSGIHGGFIIDIPFSHELFWGFNAGLSLRF